MLLAVRNQLVHIYFEMGLDIYSQTGKVGQYYSFSPEEGGDIGPSIEATLMRGGTHVMLESLHIETTLYSEILETTVSYIHRAPLRAKHIRALQK